MEPQSPFDPWRLQQQHNNGNNNSDNDDSNDNDSNNNSNNQQPATTATTATTKARLERLRLPLLFLGSLEIRAGVLSLATLYRSAKSGVQTQARWAAGSLGAQPDAQQGFSCRKSQPGTRRRAWLELWSSRSKPSQTAPLRAWRLERFTPPCCRLKLLPVDGVEICVAGILDVIVGYVDLTMDREFWLNWFYREAGGNAV